MSEINVENSHYANKALCSVKGVNSRFTAPFFNEFVIQTNMPSHELNEKLLEHDIMGGVPLEWWYPELKNCILVCVTETKTKEQIDRFADGQGFEIARVTLSGIDGGRPVGQPVIVAVEQADVVRGSALFGKGRRRCKQQGNITRATSQIKHSHTSGDACAQHNLLCEWIPEPRLIH